MVNYFDKVLSYKKNIIKCGRILLILHIIIFVRLIKSMADEP